MESVSTKISAMIAMFFSLISFILLISAFIVSINEIPPEMGVSKSFALWVFAIIVAMFSLIFYTIDAIFSFVKVFMKIDPKFNFILAVVLIGAIPMVIHVGGRLGINIYIWFSYYLLMLVLEIVSIKKHVKMMKAESQDASKAPCDTIEQG